MVSRGLIVADDRGRPSVDELLANARPLATGLDCNVFLVSAADSSEVVLKVLHPTYPRHLERESGCSPSTKR